MEEKNLKEGQVAEQTTSQDVNENKEMSMQEYFDTLKAENEQLKADNKELSKGNQNLRDSLCREYRKVEVLKAALEHLRKELSITDATFYAALLRGTSEEIDIDTILYQLSK